MYLSCISMYFHWDGSHDKKGAEHGRYRPSVEDRGFGFITVDADETDLYFNVKDLLPEEQQKARSWQVGDLLFSTKNWLDDITKQPMF